MASWDVSALYRHTASAIVPAATGQRGRDRIVSCHRERVVLRDLESLQVVRTWTLSIASPTARDTDHNSAAAAGGAAVTTFAVSPTAPHYILAFVKTSNTAWVLDPDQDGEKARIDVGAEGAVAMDWAHALEPTVMSWSAHHLRLSLFPIADTTAAKPPAFHILSPKFSPSTGSFGAPYAGHSFHPDGTFLVSLERSRPSSSTGSASSASASNPSISSLYDLISIYSTRTSEAEWALVKSFPLPIPPAQAAQVDLAGVRWSPCGRYIAAWTSATDYRVYVMSPLGHLLGTFAPYAEIASDGCKTTATKGPPTSATGRVSRLNGKPSAKMHNVAPTTSAAPQSDHERSRSERSTGSFVGLGIRTVEWHPSGEYLAIGGWDGKMRILTRFGWVAIAELGLPVPSPGGAKIASPVVVWREPPQWVEKTRGRGIVSFERPNLPYPLPTPLAVDSTRPNPRMGVEKLVFSPSGAWCAVLNPGYPTVLALYALPLPTAASASAAIGTSATTPDEQQRTRKSSRPLLGRSRLHTILLFTPDPATSDSATSAASDGRIREFRWQPNPQTVGDDDLNYGEETFAADEADIAEDGSETLVVVSGQKGFATWRSPRVGVDGEMDHGLAECVGIPAQTEFASASLSFATSSRSSPNAPLVVSASPLSAGNSEATFCVAYPVPATSGAD